MTCFNVNLQKHVMWNEHICSFYSLVSDVCRNMFFLGWQSVLIIKCIFSHRASALTQMNSYDTWSLSERLSPRGWWSSAGVMITTTTKTEWSWGSRESTDLYMTGWSQYHISNMAEALRNCCCAISRSLCVRDFISLPGNKAVVTRYSLLRKSFIWKIFFKETAVSTKLVKHLVMQDVWL